MIAIGQRRSFLTLVLQTWMRCSLTAACGIVFLFGLVAEASAQAPQRPAPGRQFLENATLPIEGNLRKRFLTAEALLADERWAEAINVLQEIAQTDFKGLVQVQQGAPGGFQTYLNVGTRCNVLMSRITAQGLKEYRQKVDPPAKRWFETWQRTRDESELLRIVRLAFLSSSGDDALLALGETAWDRGDFSAARLWWEQIIPLPEEARHEDYPTVLRYPDSDMDQPTLIARIVLCSILERETVRAEDELRRYTLKFPSAEGWIAGRNGVLADLLKQELEKSRLWPPVTESAEIETFALSPSRFKMLPQSIDIGSQRWSHPLSPNLLPHPVDGFPFQNSPFSYHPVAYDGVVMVNDADSIRAWNLWTGEPAWKSEQSDPAIIYPTNSDQQSALPDKMCVGVPDYTMTIAGNRLYARMGSAVTAASNLPQRDLDSDLVCLDLNQQGKLVWNIPSRKILNDPSWRYEGSPVVRGGRAFITLCRRRPQLQLMVVCLDAQDGRVLWQQSIGGFKTSVDDSQNRVSHLLLTLGGGRVFLSTDAGAIVALDEFDGRFEWAVTYESRTDETPASLSDPSQKGLLPAMFYRGWLIAAPNDADSAFCIEADSGRVRWQFSYIQNMARDIPDLLKRELHAAQRKDNRWRQLLGVAPGGSVGRLIVSGKSLTAIDLDSGNRIWQTPRTAFGRGLLAGDQIYLPGRTAIEVCSQQTGQLLRTVTLKVDNPNQQGGNLTLANGMLLVTQPNRIAAYCDYSQLKERIERDLTLHPDDPNLLIQLADLEAADGVRSAVKDALQKVLAIVPPDDPNHRIARGKLAKIWRDSGRSAFEQTNVSQARDDWKQALSLTDDPSRKVELLFNLASTETDNPSHAIRWLQSILDDDQLTAIQQGGTTAGQEAEDKISLVIARAGQDAYAEIQSVADDELARMKAQPDSQQLTRFFKRFPHAKGLDDARRLLATSYRTAGKIPEAYAVLAEMRRVAADSTAYARHTASMIDLLESVGSRSGANSLWSSLTKLEPVLPIEIRGKTQNLNEALKEWQSSKESASKSRPIGLQQRWKLDLPAKTTVIFPEDEAPRPEASCVLLCFPDALPSRLWTWRCVDWQQGHVRWEAKSSAAIQVARWTPVQLLIGSAVGWQARDIDQGRLVWQTEQLDGPTTHWEASTVVSTNESGERTVWPVLCDVESGIAVIDVNTGTIVSRLKPPGRLHPIFSMGDAITLGITDDPSAGEAALDQNQIETARGRIEQERPLYAFFQTRKPTRIWLAKAASPRKPWTFREISDDSTKWISPPMGLQNRIIGLTEELQLVAYPATGSPQPTQATEVSRTLAEERSILADFLRRSLAERDAARLDEQTEERILLQTKSHGDRRRSSTDRSSWRFRNFATGQALPMAWTDGGDLIAVNDGARLVSFNPIDGTRNWSTGIADFPMESPARQVGVFGPTVFLTSQGWLRGVDTRSGNIRVERYLGHDALQWQTTIAWKPNSSGRGVTAATSKPESDESPLLAIWPLNTKDSSISSIWICDGGTGEAIQRLTHSGQPRRVVITDQGDGVIWAGDQLTGWKSASTMEAIADKQ